MAAIWAAVLWCVRLLDVTLSLNLPRFGIYPGELHGLWGIVAAPLIHGSPEHLIANTLPVLVLGSALFYGYPRSRWWTLFLVWVLSGIGVWLWGRPSSHFGASGVMHGLLFFLFISGVIRRDKMSIVLCMVAFSMYGGMLMTIFPTEPEISFEAHFFGAMAGALCAILFQRLDPKMRPKQYSWDKTARYEEDPVIGDLWMTEKQRSKLVQERELKQAEWDSATDVDSVKVSSIASIIHAEATDHSEAINEVDQIGDRR